MEETISNGQAAGDGKGKIRPVLIGMIAVGVILAGGVLFMMRGSDEEKSEMSGTKEMSGENISSEMSGDAEEGMSLRDLLGMGKSQKCTFKNESEGMKSEGTFYVSGGKSRAMVSNTVSGGKGGTTTSNMIFDTASNTTYVWTEGMKEGVKMTMNDADQEEAPVSDDDTAEEVPDASTSNDFTRDLDQEYSYDCDSWKTDASLFVVPSDVAFVDMAEMMKALPNPATLPQMNPTNPSGMPTSNVPRAGSGDMKKASCAACDQAGDQKEACQKALGC